MRPLRRLMATLDGGAGDGDARIHANGGRHHGRGREGREGGDQTLRGVAPAEVPRVERALRRGGMREIRGDVGRDAATRARGDDVSKLANSSRRRECVSILRD